MPCPDRKRQAAKQHEQQHRDRCRDEIDVEYHPQDPFCIPYWAAFYKNPYPNTEARRVLAGALGVQPETLATWFHLARLFTHTPESKEIASETQSEEILGETDTNEESTKECIVLDGDDATLYAHFYTVKREKGERQMRVHKRAHSESVELPLPKRAAGASTENRGPRGPYKGNSRTTIYRNRKHAGPMKQFLVPMQPRLSTLPGDSSVDLEIEIIDAPTEAGPIDLLPEIEATESPLQLEPNTSEPIVLGPDSLNVIESEEAEEDDKVLLEMDDYPEIEVGAISGESATAPGCLDLEEYQNALAVLESELECLKVTVPGSPIHTLSEDASEPSSTATIVLQETSMGVVREEGPTPWDSDNGVRPSIKLLDAEEEEYEGAVSYTTLGNHLKRLIKQEKKVKSPSFTTLIDLTVLSDYNVLRECLRLQGCSSPNTVASDRIASCKAATIGDRDPKMKGLWYARRLRSKAVHVIRFGELPRPNQGRGATHHSLLSNEDVRHAILAYLRSLNMGQITPHRLMQEANQQILPALSISNPISESTALRWLWRLGYKPTKYSKGVWGSTSPSDPAPLMASPKVPPSAPGPTACMAPKSSHRDHSESYESSFYIVVLRIQDVSRKDQVNRTYNDKTAEPLPLILPVGIKEHIPVTQDECCFHANDQQDQVWLREGDQQLRQKSRGRITHVSDFLTQKDGGRLVLAPEALAENNKLAGEEKLLITDACKIIEPGKGHDQWWDMEQLCSQLKSALRIYDRLFPNTVGVFFFDQSSAHNAFGDDALVAKRMNVGSGGKNTKKMHETKIPMDNPNPEMRGLFQLMVFPPGHPNEGEPKGMRIILGERRLLGTLDIVRGGQPVGVCATCKKSEAARTKAEKEARERMEEDPKFYQSIDDAGFEEHTFESPKTGENLAWTQSLRELRRALGSTKIWLVTFVVSRCLETQQDFLDKKPRIQLMIEAAGHKCLFLPKFHCELNPIEMYWGYSKRLFRQKCDGTLPTARRLVPECLNSCNTVTIRHFWRKCWRYMDAYSKGLTGKQAEFAVKKYKSHRRIGAQVMDETEEHPKKG
ncbi:hypothetical protein BDV93DRAFT_513540 [Ceratobasidium sp. AG-I]|nr:hypothetical protein BDV93DRAFT_513540 [Ceratobasidium sp. AG-I]